MRTVSTNQLNVAHANQLKRCMSKQLNLCSGKLRFEISWRDFIRDHGLYGSSNFNLFSSRCGPEL